MDGFRVVSMCISLMGEDEHIYTFAKHLCIHFSYKILCVLFFPLVLNMYLREQERSLSTSGSLPGMPPTTRAGPGQGPRIPPRSPEGLAGTQALGPWSAACPGAGSWVRSQGARIQPGVLVWHVGTTRSGLTRCPTCQTDF